MADTKWSALPTVANLLDSDRLTLVRDPTGARTPSTIPGSVLKSELAAYFDTLYQPADAQLDVYAGIAPSGFGQSWIQLTNAAAGRVALGVRDTLSGTRTYYVRTDGSDSNDGLANTAGGAFLTIAKGISAAYAIDTSLYNVVIQLADGTYSAGALAARPFVGLGAITIQGNAGTPANVIVSVANNNVFVSQYGANIHIKDLTMVTTGTGGYHMAADSGGGITFANVRFGAVAGSYSHIYSNSAGRVTCLGNYAIVGGAQAHFYSINMSYIFVAGMTVTLTGTPAFSLAFAYSDQNSNIIAHANTFSGAATGSRYSVNGGAVIYTAGAGATYLPGNAVGTGTNFSASPWGLYS